MEINKKIRDTIFSMMIFTLIFNNIPVNLQVKILGGNLGSKLVLYPVIIGIIIFVYYVYKDKNNLKNFKKFFYFSCIFFIMNTISGLLGLYKFPYFDEIILNGEIESKVNLIEYNYISEVELTYFWIFARLMKNLINELICTFFISYIIYCWYYDDWKEAFKVIVKMIKIIFIVIFIYNIIELFYLCGSNIAKDILVKINPYIHQIKTDSIWWPPILWKDQMRSIFAEPSYFGIYISFILPFIWYKINKRNNYFIYLFVLLFFMFSLFLAQSRIAICLFLVEIVILTYFAFRISDKNFYKNLFVIIICSFVAFNLSNFYINNFINNELEKNVISKTTNAINHNNLDVKKFKINDKTQKSDNHVLKNKDHNNDYFEKIYIH